MQLLQDVVALKVRFASPRQSFLSLGGACLVCFPGVIKKFAMLFLNSCAGQRFTRNMIAELTKAILAIQEIDGTHQQVASVPALTPAIDSYLSKPVVCSNTSKWVELYVPGDCLIVISNSTA